MRIRIDRAKKLCLFLAVVLMLSGMCAAITRPRPAYNSTMKASVQITKNVRVPSGELCALDMLPVGDSASGHSDSGCSEDHMDFKIYLNMLFIDIYLAPQGMSAFISDTEKFFYPNSAGLVEGYIHRSDGKKRA